MENALEKGQLVESQAMAGKFFPKGLVEKWDIGKFLDGVPDHRKMVISQLLECQIHNGYYASQAGGFGNKIQVPNGDLNWLLEQGKKEIRENTLTANIVGFSRHILPLMRKVFSKSAILDLVSLQPMRLPSQKIYYIDFEYGTAEAGLTPAIVAGDSVYDGTGTDRELYTLDGGPGVTEGTLVNDLDLRVRDSDLTVETHKLRAKISVELEQDLAAEHNVNAMTELSNAGATILRRNMEKRIVSDLRTIAIANSSTAFAWNDGAYAGTEVNENNIAYREAQLRLFVEKESQAMWDQRFIRPNFLVCSSNVIAGLSTLPSFRTFGDLSLSTLINDGERRAIGTWGGLVIYIDPFLAANNCVLGHRGTDAFSTGYVVGMYIPFIMTDVFTNPDDFTRVRGFMSRWGKASVEHPDIGTNQFYRHFTITGI